jgi:hypothetical protein
MQVDIQQLRAQQAAELAKASSDSGEVVQSCFFYFAVVIVGYVVIRDAVMRGILNAERHQEKQRLKAAEKAERALQAQRQAKPATASGTPASPRSSPPGASGNRRTA